MCFTENALGALSCGCCGFEFPKKPTRLKKCQACGAFNPVAAEACQACGESFSPSFSLTLNEALRTGAIVRGLDIDEQSVKASEEMASAVRTMVFRSGDARLVQVLSSLPEESWFRLRQILDAGKTESDITTY